MRFKKSNSVAIILLTSLLAADNLSTSSDRGEQGERGGRWHTVRSTLSHNTWLTNDHQIVSCGKTSNQVLTSGQGTEDRWLQGIRLHVLDSLTHVTELYMFKFIILVRSVKP